MSPAPLPTILVALCNAGLAARIEAALAGQVDVVTAPKAGAALEAMRDHDVQAALCASAHSAHEELLQRLAQSWPHTQRLLLAEAGEDAGGNTGGAVDMGLVHQVVPLPLSEAQLRLAVRGACRTFALGRENERLALEAGLRAPAPRAATQRHVDALAEGIAFDAILRAAGSPVNAVVAEAARIASFDVPVLLAGEAATGKAALAQAIHRTSLRSDRPFHTLDLRGLPDTALQVELFGARHGALPGLAASRSGLAQRAHRGTLFLDGIETLSPEMQLALLRLIEDGAARSVGATDAQPAAPRLIAGTTADLAAEMRAGRFRADLYYALAVTELALPPLRERSCDLPAIAVEMLAEAARIHAKPVRGFAPEALEFLGQYDWPGNLRELHNEVTRMLIAADGPVLGPDLISRRILQQAECGCCCTAPGAEGTTAGGGAGRGRETADVMAGTGTLKDRVEQIEARILTETLTRLKWNKSRAAADLGLSRVGLRAKLDRYGLIKPVAAPAATAAE